MSLDYPFYEELRRRKHRAATWWLIGDRLYYLGLGAAILAVPGIALAGLASQLGYGAGAVFVLVAVFAAGLAVWVTGASLKGHAYRLAARDGIEVRW